ncbi:MAG: GNAT family N-acetyltransferase [Lysobacterales bacterium]
MTQLVFAELEFRKLVAPVLEPNLASMRVLEKCGYKSEGCFRNHVFKDGTYFDVFQYAKHYS